ncbi:MAG: exosortase H-associated membrane protein [Tahibacter sp.]
MKAPNPLRRFIFAALAWLPLCFFLWWWVSGLSVWLPVTVASWVLRHGWPGLVSDVKMAFDTAGLPIMEVLTKVTSLQRAPNGQQVMASLDPIVHPLIYGYSLPLFFGLTLATPQEEGRRWLKLIFGAVVIWLAQSFGLVAEALKNIAFMSGPEGISAAHAAGVHTELVALCYQFGYLILPTVVPAVLWLALNRQFIESLAGRSFGEPASGDAGPSATA